MKIMQILRDIRLEFGIKQTDVNKETTSKSRFSRLELGDLNPDWDEVIYFATNIGIRATELLHYAKVSKASDYPYLKLKQEPFKYTEESKDFEKKFTQSYLNRLINQQYYSIYILYFHRAKTLNVSFLKKDKIILKEIAKHFQNRTKYYAIDTEIFVNLAEIYSYSQLEFLYKKFFPVRNSKGEIYDFGIQIILDNLLSKMLRDKEFTHVQKIFDEIQNIRNIPGFEMNGYFDLKYIYLKHLYDFLKNRNIESYLKAVKIVELYKQMGREEIYKYLLKEISILAAENNFKLNQLSLQASDINSEIINLEQLKYTDKNIH